MEQANSLGIKSLVDSLMAKVQEKKSEEAKDNTAGQPADASSGTTTDNPAPGLTSQNRDLLVDLDALLELLKVFSSTLQVA